jgi:DNA-binding NarL/FixJ family response regulator
MKILIVHDWAIVRSGNKQVLADEFDPWEITERASVPDGFDMASGRWDLALVAKRWLLKPQLNLHLARDVRQAVWGVSA